MKYRLQWINKVEIAIKNDHDELVGKAFRHEGTVYNVFTFDLRDCGKAPGKGQIIGTYLLGKDIKRAAPEPSICPGCPLAGSGSSNGLK